MNKVPVSVVVIAKNEEARIGECLRSVEGWAGEIVVVDDESTDGTLEIAKRHGAAVYRRKMDNEGAHRNWAYAQARQPWVLSLDADETVTEELKAEIAAAVTNTALDAFSIPMRNFVPNRRLSISR